MVSTKLERRVMKKMGRVMGANPAASSATSTATDLSPVLPAPIPQNALFMTKREVMLKKTFAKKDRTITSVKKTAPSAPSDKKRAHPTKIVAPPSTSGPSSAVPSHHMSRRQKASFTAGKPNKNQIAREAAQRVVQRHTLANMANNAVDGNTKTTLNASSGQRHQLFVSELNQFNRVQTLPEFQSNPILAIEQHLNKTMQRLLPQTADYGRKKDSAMPVTKQGINKLPNRR